MKLVTLATLEDFIRHGSNGLRQKLRKDMLAFRMIKEADVECSAYFHLRRFLRRDRRWQVFARKHSVHTGFYTDLIIYKGHKPRVAIEIKWRHKEITPKDRAALNAALRRPYIRKVYFLSAVPDGVYTRLPNKKKPEKYRLFECVVDLGFKDKARVREYEDRRRRFRASA